MCLIVEKNTPRQITTEDMIVFKALESDNRPVFRISFQYEENKLLETEIKESGDMTFAGNTQTEYYRKTYLLPRTETSYPFKIIDFSRLKSYGQGFHFSIDEKGAKENTFGYGHRIARFLIPAGSEIILDETGLGITNQIMLLPD